MSDGKVILTDDSEMPYGKYKGEAMCNVPDNYLVYIYENNMCNPEVKAYIEDNADSLKIKIKK